MVKNISLFLDKIFIYLYMASFCVGFLFPSLAVGRPLIPILIGVLVFFSSLNIATLEPAQIKLDAPIITIFLFFSILIMPLFLYSLLNAFPIKRNIIVGLFLIASAPPGVSTIPWVKYANGDTLLAIKITVLVSLLYIIYLPLFSWFLLSASIAVPITILVTQISIMLIAPIGLAMIVRYLFYDFVEGNDHIFTSISQLLILPIVGIIIAVNADIMPNEVNNIILGVGLISGFFVVNTIITISADRFFSIGFKKLITIVYCLNRKNLGLVMALAILYFDPKIALIIAVGSAVQAVWSLLFYRIFKKGRLASVIARHTLSPE